MRIDGAESDSSHIVQEEETKRVVGRNRGRALQPDILPG